MYSIGDFVDKLVIENIKTFNTRQAFHKEGLKDDEYVNLNHKMMILNDNKTTIQKMLNEKIERVVSGEEKNRILTVVKTF